MFTTSSTSLRRLSGYVLTLLLSSVCLSADVAAQAPLVTSSSPVAIPHTESYGAPWQSAVSNRGDFVLFDFKTGGIYEYPATGGPEITIGAPGKFSGGFTDSGVAIDPRNNNIYLNNNYNGGLQELPFDTKTGSWDLPSTVVASGLSGNLGGSCGNYFQSAGMSMNHKGVLAVATENGCGKEIFTVTIDGSGNFGPATSIVANMSDRAKTVAIDDAGNIYFNEDSNGLKGAYYIPAGTAGLTTDTAVTRIDPKLGNVQGVTVDDTGNLYIADGNTGEYLVPLVAGVPTPANAILLSPALSNGGPSIDGARGVLFTPTSGYNNISDVIKIYLERVELGTSAAGTAGANPGVANYTFNGTATPYSFVINESGTTTGDFAFAPSDLAGCGITFAPDQKDPTKQDETATTYNAGQTCTLPITFTPHSVGDISGTLVMLDQAGNVLDQTVLHGVGVASEAIAAPALVSAIGSALKTPSQIATDLSGNLYIADSGLGKVLEYPKGSIASSTPSSVGTGLTAPTGVAVDGAGDVFIADSGTVVVVPFTNGELNAAGQFTVKTGFGTNLKLASDRIGDLFVADPDNQRVVRLRDLITSFDETDIGGFTAISAIAADGTGDLFVADGTNLIEYSALGQQTVVTTLSGATGLAVDPSGSVYVSQTNGTILIPNEGGVLTTADQIAIAPTVTTPASVAVDSAGNAYVADATAGNVGFVSSNASLTFGTLVSTTGTQALNVTIVNEGDAPLNITGFTKTPDFSETSTTCIGAPIAVGANCAATITFNPGPGDQGTLSGQVVVQGDAFDSPVTINAVGVGAPLAGSTTTITVTKPTVTNTTIVVAVASTSGKAPVPTGDVTVTVTGNGMQPQTFTKPLANGSVTFNPTTIPAGSLTFTAKYIGDRVYGVSTASTTVTVAQGTVMLIQPAAASVPVYVLASENGSAEPYDGSQVPYYYNYPVTVVAANGAPLLGVPVFSGSKQTGIDYGIVTYKVSVGTAASGCTPVNVNADGTAPLGTQCFGIDTSNNQIPNIETTYTVTPVYTGNTDPNYASATGTPVTFIALRNPSVIITSNPASLSVAAGSTATANLTLTSLLGYGVTGVNGNLNNYSLPVELNCDNLPAHASCTFTYPTPDPSDANSTAVTPTAPGKAVMTINTNVAVGTTSASITRITATYAAMFGMSLLGLAFGRKKTLQASVFRVICLLLFSGAVAGLSACSSANISASPILTTPKGTYTVTVTAKQTGSKLITQNGAIKTVYGNGNLMSLPFTVSVVVQ